MNQIETKLTCQSAPKTFTDALAQGKSKTHKVTIAAKSRSAQLALSWTSPLDKFKISGLKIVRHGKVVAPAVARRKLKVKVRDGHDLRGRQGLAPGQGQAALQGQGDEDRLRPAEGDADDPGEPEPPPVSGSAHQHDHAGEHQQHAEELRHRERLAEDRQRGDHRHDGIHRHHRHRDDGIGVLQCHERADQARGGEGAGDCRPADARANPNDTTPVAITVMASTE